MYSLDSNTTYSIIEKALTVYKELGFGFLEKTYQSALALELSWAGFDIKEEKQVKVFYKKTDIDTGFLFNFGKNGFEYRRCFK